MLAESNTPGNRLNP